MRTINPPQMLCRCRNPVVALAMDDHDSMTRRIDEEGDGPETLATCPTDPHPDQVGTVMFTRAELRQFAAWYLDRLTR